MFPTLGSYFLLIISREIARKISLRSAFVVLLFVSTLSLGQGSKGVQAGKPASENFEQHYDAARTFQLSRDQDRAVAEYEKFLIEALRVSAKANVALGERDKAAALFEDALALTPDNPQLRVEFAQLRFQQQNFGEARTLAEKVLTSAPDNAQAHLVLGQILFAQADFKGAREHLEEAVVSAPGFDVAYLLGITYIKLNDFSRARLVFDDMLASFGDTAQIHMMFGRAYKQGGWEALDNAVKELNLAIARDGRVQHAHYLLALAYIDRDGESAFPQAASELRTELKINPNDARSHYLLGYVAMKQHDAKNAEAELLKAAELDPKNPDPLVYLGQIYSDADRDAEAEADLRKAIALSGSTSRTDYLIGRAHYILGRVLLKGGESDEGKRELEASQAIRDKMNRPDLVRDTKLKSDPELASVSHDESIGSPPAQVDVPSQKKEEVQAYLEHLKPAIADSYNNLGVFQAGRQNFVEAAQDFKKAGEWNPSLETLDRNWGMAAFYAKNYQEAVPPLTRQLEKHPEDVKVRAALALSLFIGQNFKATLDMLKPIQQEAENDPGLDYAYSVSLVKVGDYDEGTRRLRLLAEKDPNSADIHMLLGSALADQREYGSALQEYRKSLAIDPNQEQTHYLTGVALIEDGHPKESVDELRTALKLNPSDVSAKYHLAFSLIQVQQTDEAKRLLREVIQQDPNRADAYYELGKLQLDQGDTKGAVQSLEAAIKASPDSDYIHYQLAMAYRRDSRNEDAQREIKVYQSLKDRQRGHGDVPQTN
ncbi:MAG: tetratricopeptide repeat protein [Terriglobales bacterium]